MRVRTATLTSCSASDWTGAPAVDLGSLDGTNGFRIAGETGDLLGESVRSAGDVNGDGIADMIVGAPDGAGRIGESYVIFGKTDWAGTPVIDVASLDGSDGFRLIGSNINDLAAILSPPRAT